jgi:hypothetical protein
LLTIIQIIISLDLQYIHEVIKIHIALLVGDKLVNLQPKICLDKLYVLLIFLLIKKELPAPHLGGFSHLYSVSLGVVDHSQAVGLACIVALDTDEADDGVNAAGQETAWETRTTASLEIGVPHDGGLEIFHEKVIEDCF